jgi:hypothetical protein
MDKTEHNKKAFLNALRSNMCNVSASCEAAGIGRTTFYDWNNNDEAFKKAVSNLREEVVDFAESKLFEQISEGNTTAIIYFLKTQGAKRGYNENHLKMEDPAKPPRPRECFIIGGKTIYFD